MTNNDHENLMNLFKISINEIIKNDSLLNDMHSNITLEEVNNLVSFEHGDSMVLYVCRADNQIMNIIVRQNATLKDLKSAIKQYILLKNSRENNTTILNWKYIWKLYCLCFNNEKLIDNGKLLKDYGVYNKAKLTFLKQRL
jgi:U11/U12 small nuclear ribonucleoprotein SNRNP25